MCKIREATIFAMSIRDGKSAQSSYCEECFPAEMAQSIAAVNESGCLHCGERCGASVCLPCATEHSRFLESKGYQEIFEGLRSTPENRELAVEAMNDLEQHMKKWVANGKGSPEVQARSLEFIFEEALDAFLEKERSSLLSEVSERNTCGRLSIYLERQIEKYYQVGLYGYYADVEYNSKQRGEVKTIIDEHSQIIQITPDLIIHSRGEKRNPRCDNLIAVAMKNATRPEDAKVADKKRIRAMTKSLQEVWGCEGSNPEHVCGYLLGLYIEIDIEHRQLRLEYFKEGVSSRKIDKPF